MATQSSQIVSYSFVRDSVSKYKMEGNGEKLWKTPNVNLRIIYTHIHVCIHCVYRRRNGLKSRKGGNRNQRNFQIIHQTKLVNSSGNSSM